MNTKKLYLFTFLTILNLAGILFHLKIYNTNKQTHSPDKTSERTSIQTSANRLQLERKKSNHATKDLADNQLEINRIKLLDLIANSTETLDSIWKTIIEADVQHEDDRYRMLQELITDRFAFENLNEISQLIEDTVSESKWKQSLHRTLYSSIGFNSSFDEVTITLLNEDIDNSFLTAICQGLIQRKNHSDTVNWLSQNPSIVEKLTSDPSNMNYFVAILGEGMQKSPKEDHQIKVEEFKKFLSSQVLSGSIKREITTGYATAIANRNPSLAWALFTEAIDGNPMNKQASLQEKYIIDSIVKIHKPKEALELLTKAKTISAKNAEHALYSLIKQNHLLVEQWHADGRLGDQSGLTENYIGALARVTTENHDYRSALEHAMKINDATYRNEVEENIIRSERTYFLEKFSQAPEQNIEDAIDGKFIGDHLQDGISEWTKIDSDTATTWISTNWERLNQTQQSDIASALARHALSNNDVSGAKEWMKHVKAPSEISE